MRPPIKIKIAAMFATISYQAPRHCPDTTSFSFCLDASALNSDADLQRVMCDVCTHKRRLNDVNWTTVEEHNATYDAYQELHAVITGMLASNPHLTPYYEQLKVRYNLSY